MMFCIYIHRFISAHSFDVGLHCSGKTASGVKGLWNVQYHFSNKTNVSKSCRLIYIYLIYLIPGHHPFRSEIVMFDMCAANRRQHQRQNVAIPAEMALSTNGRTFNFKMNRKLDIET